MDDDDLIAAVAAGDEGALRELFTRHAPWLAGRLHRVVSATVAEDVLQETFVAVWRGAGRYRPDGRAGAWLWGIARRQAALWIRRHPAPPPVFRGPAAGDPAASDPEAIVVERAEIADAVAALGPPGSPERELWRLLFEEDRSVADVAERLGIRFGCVADVNDLAIPTLSACRAMSQVSFLRPSPTGASD